MVLESLKLVQHHMSKQNRKSTEWLYLEQLEGYKDLFRISGWVSALSYAVRIIIPLYVLIKHKCNAQSCSWEFRKKTLQDLKSAVVFSRKLLFCMGQGGLWNRKELFKPSGRCLKSRARRGTRAPHVNMEFLWDFPEPEERSKAKWYPKWSCCTVGMLTIFVGVVVP